MRVPDAPDRCQRAAQSISGPVHQTQDAQTSPARSVREEQKPHGVGRWMGVPPDGRSQGPPRLGRRGPGEISVAVPDDAASLDLGLGLHGFSSGLGWVGARTRGQFQELPEQFREPGEALAAVPDDAASLHLRLGLHGLSSWWGWVGRVSDVRELSASLHAGLGLHGPSSWWGWVGRVSDVRELSASLHAGLGLMVLPLGGGGWVGSQMFVSCPPAFTRVLVFMVSPLGWG